MNEENDGCKLSVLDLQSVIQAIKKVPWLYPYGRVVEIDIFVKGSVNRYIRLRTNPIMSHSEAAKIANECEERIRGMKSNEQSSDVEKMLWNATTMILLIK